MSELASVKLLDVKPMPNYRLGLLFATQERKVFDVSPYIKGSWYGELKALAYFAKVMFTLN